MPLPPRPLHEIPLDELLGDLADSASDASACNIALKSGLVKSGLTTQGGLSIQYRYDRNLEIMTLIRQEILRRFAALENRTSQST